MDKRQATKKYGSLIVEKARDMYETDFGKVMFEVDVESSSDIPLEITSPEEVLNYLERAKVLNPYRLFNEDRELGQNQYASRYIDGSHGKPNLGQGLRFSGDLFDYHRICIHVDDYDIFHQRVKDHLKSLEEE